jgi:hypothetical protein
MRRRLVETLVVAVLCAPAFPAGAMPLGTTARQSANGSLKLLAYYQGASEQAVDFTVAGSGSCASANGVSFACSQSGEVDAKGDGRAAMLKLAVQIGDYIQPYATFGSGSYELSVPSNTLTNKLTGNSGLLYGGGVKFSVVPETMVDAAFALDLGYTRSSYDFTRVSPGGFPGAGPLDQTLTLDTFQLAVEASKRFALKGSQLEPYGGVKMMRVHADLKDHPGGGRAGGKTDTASPFLGLRWGGDKLAGFMESSFVGGYHYGAGLEYRFN